MLIVKDGNIELHQIDSEESFKELSKGAIWNIPRFEYESETILVVKSPGKRRAIRVERGLFFNEKNVLLDFDKLINSYSYKIQKGIKNIISYNSVIFLKEEIKKNKIDYNKIKKDSIIIIQNQKKSYDINFIITARGRVDFAQPMLNSFNSAKEKTSLNITYTVVEHSEIPEHAKFCKKNKLNYIWIKSDDGELFNKCLSYNMAVFFGNKSKRILFHDIDCLVQSDFFIKLFENISSKKCKAIQCFTKRRVLYISEEFTPNVVSGEFSVDELSINMDEVDYPRMGGEIMLGAPGGSIMVERDLFFEVGGYDAELFVANSPEDAFFWTKIDSIDKMHTSNEPNIEIYHMYHPPTWMHNPRSKEVLDINRKFNLLTKDKKIEIIKLKKELIKEFK